MFSNLLEASVSGPMHAAPLVPRHSAIYLRPSPMLLNFSVCREASVSNKSQLLAQVYIFKRLIWTTRGTRVNTLNLNRSLITASYFILLWTRKGWNKIVAAAEILIQNVNRKSLAEFLCRRKNIKFSRVMPESYALTRTHTRYLSLCLSLSVSLSLSLSLSLSQPFLTEGPFVSFLPVVSNLMALSCLFLSCYTLSSSLFLPLSSFSAWPLFFRLSHLFSCTLASP